MIRWHRGDGGYWGQTHDRIHFRVRRVDKAHWRLEHTVENLIGVWVDHGVFDSKRAAQLEAYDIAAIKKP